MLPEIPQSPSELLRVPQSSTKFFGAPLHSSLSLLVAFFELVQFGKKINGVHFLKQFAKSYLQALSSCYYNICLMPSVNNQIQMVVISLSWNL